LPNRGDRLFGPRPLIDKGDDHIIDEMKKINGSIKLVPGFSGYAHIMGVLIYLLRRKPH